MKEFLTYLILNILLTNDLNAIELRKKIVIIDTGLNWSEEIAPFICKDGWMDITHTARLDTIGHGTNVIGIVSKYIDNKEFCIISLKAIKTRYNDDMGTYLKGLKFTQELRPFALNLSLEGRYPDKEERSIIESLVNSGTKVIVSAGNHGMNLDYDCNVFPACYNINHEKFYIVGSVNGLNERSRFSNYGRIVNAKENGENVEAGGYVLSGTSQAAAIKTGKLCQIHSK